MPRWSFWGRLSNATFTAIFGRPHRGSSLLRLSWSFPGLPTRSGALYRRRLASVARCPSGATVAADEGVLRGPVGASARRSRAPGPRRAPGVHARGRALGRACPGPRQRRGHLHRVAGADRRGAARSRGRSGGRAARPGGPPRARVPARADRRVAAAAGQLVRCGLVHGGDRARGRHREMAVGGAPGVEARRTAAADNAVARPAARGARAGSSGSPSRSGTTCTCIRERRSASCCASSASARSASVLPAGRLSGGGCCSRVLCVDRGQPLGHQRHGLGRPEQLRVLELVQRHGRGAVA